jgi:hypothetical protein
MYLIHSFLADKPVKALMVSLTSFIPSWIDALTPVLQFLGLVLGVLIAAFTLYFQVQKAIKQKKK